MKKRNQQGITALMCACGHAPKAPADSIANGDPLSTRSKTAVTQSALEDQVVQVLIESVPDHDREALVNAQDHHGSNALVWPHHHLPC